MNPMPSTLAAPSATVPASAPTSLPHVAADCAARATCRSVALDIGKVLRIREGRGLRVTPATGVLWITEENSATDTVLLAGETYRIAFAGLALVLAHRSSLVLLELDPGVAPPRSVDFSDVDGMPGRRVAFVRSYWLPAHAWSKVVRRLIRRALSIIAPSAQDHPRPGSAAGGWFGHDTLHSSRVVRHNRRELVAPAPLRRNGPGEIVRDLFFPYY